MCVCGHTSVCVWRRRRDRRKEREDRVDAFLFSDSFDLYGLEMKPIARLRTNKVILLRTKQLNGSSCVVACALIVPRTPTDASAGRPKGENDQWSQSENPAAFASTSCVLFVEFQRNLWALAC